MRMYMCAHATRPAGVQRPAAGAAPGGGAHPAQEGGAGPRAGGPRPRGARAADPARGAARAGSDPAISAGNARGTPNWFQMDLPHPICQMPPHLLLFLLFLLLSFIIMALEEEEAYTQRTMIESVCTF